MDQTNASFAIDHDTHEPAADIADAAGRHEPFYEVFLAMQKYGAQRRLDAGLVDLVTDKAREFAGLTPREQAALAWVEAVISSGKTQTSDGAYAALRRHFDDASIAKLTALAGTASARAKLGAGKRA